MKKPAAIAALGALAHESRLDVFRLLVTAGAPGLAAGVIGERLNVPAPTLSFHLAQLRHAGLVEVRRDGRSQIYSADFDAMNGLMVFLTANCCAGDASQCAPLVCNPAKGTLTRAKGATRQ